MAPKSGKTITTFLIDGSPNGLKTVFISNKLCKALVIPRVQFADLETREEAHQPALYFLLNETDEKLYIGETENFLNRAKDHQSTKVFWDKAIIFVSKDKDLTKSDIKYLEYLSLHQARANTRYNLDENKTLPKPTHLPEHQIATVEEFFENVKILTAFLGIPIFDQHDHKKTPTFYCNARGAKATGYYDSNGFTVQKGSIVANKNAKTCPAPEKRQALLERASIKGKDNIVHLKEDLLFSSPSAASAFCTGASTNGWILWKTKENQTLDDVVRKQ
jgi:Domain of unknown function (DUF4357)